VFKYLDSTYITHKIEAIDSLSLFPIVNLLHFFLLFYCSYITKPEQPQIIITKEEGME